MALNVHKPLPPKPSSFLTCWCCPTFGSMNPPVVPDKNQAVPLVRIQPKARSPMVLKPLPEPSNNPSSLSVISEDDSYFEPSRMRGGCGDCLPNIFHRNPNRLRRSSTILPPPSQPRLGTLTVPLDERADSRDHIRDTLSFHILSTPRTNISTFAFEDPTPITPANIGDLNEVFVNDPRPPETRPGIIVHMQAETEESGPAEEYEMKHTVKV